MTDEPQPTAGVTDQPQPLAGITDEPQPLPPPADPAGRPLAAAAERPELKVAGAFAGGWLLAMLLRRLVR